MNTIHAQAQAWKTKPSTRNAMTASDPLTAAIRSPTDAFEREVSRGSGSRAGSTDEGLVAGAGAS